MALTQVKTLGIADDAVTEAKVANDAISPTEMKAGTDGHIITYDASGNPTTVGPGSDGQVLTSTGAGSPPAFEAIPAAAVTALNNATANELVTVGSTTTELDAETDLTFDGSTLTVHQQTSSNAPALKLVDRSGAATDLGFHYEAYDGSSDVVITNGGNVGINTVSPTGRLHIDSTHHVVTNSGKAVSGIHLDGPHGNAGEYSPGISFTCGGVGAAGIAGRQMTSSQQPVGLSFFVHPSTTGSDDAIEKVRIMDGGTCLFNNGIGLGNGLTYAASNTMDDYEEGTFTATCSNSVTLHSDTNACGYTKIGRLVTITGQIRVNSDSNNATFKVNNLPFTAADTDDQSSFTAGGCRIWSWDINVSDHVGIVCSISENVTVLEFFVNRDGQSAVALPASAGGYIAFSLSYPAA